MSDMEYDPEKNPKVILLSEEGDGNWIARGRRFGKFMRVRGNGPETVLRGLLTADGTKEDMTV
jgi:hypothetical protein